jgi:hypothetical protein
MFLQNWHPFLGEAEEILLGGLGDNDQQPQFHRKNWPNDSS